MRLKRTSGAALLAGLLVCAASGINAQTSSAEFAPVEQWRKAVLSGDENALAQLYAANARILGPGNKQVSRADDITYWKEWKGKGLTELSARIEEEQEPQPGLHVELMELTFTARSGRKLEKSYLAMAQGWVQDNGLWNFVMVQRREAVPFRKPDV